MFSLKTSMGKINVHIKMKICKLISLLLKELLWFLLVVS